MNYNRPKIVIKFLKIVQAQLNNYHDCHAINTAIGTNPIGFKPMHVAENTKAIETVIRLIGDKSNLITVPSLFVW